MLAVSGLCDTGVAGHWVATSGTKEYHRHNNIEHGFKTALRHTKYR